MLSPVPSLPASPTRPPPGVRVVPGLSHELRSLRGGRQGLRLPAPLSPRPEVLLFEVEDLVLRKNVKNVVLCLLELGRRAWSFGVAAPALVRLEGEIEEELRLERAPPPPEPPARRPCHFRDLDQLVRTWTRARAPPLLPHPAEHAGLQFGAPTHRSQGSGTWGDTSGRTHQVSC